MVKLRDFVNLVKNKKNYQERLDIKKTQLKKFDMDVEELLNQKISMKKKVFD